VGDFFSTQLYNSSTNLLRWDVRKAEDFPGGFEDLRNAIINEDCWAVALSEWSPFPIGAEINSYHQPLVNANTTNQLNSAVLSSTTEYNASLAVTVFLNEARNENA